MNDLNGLDWSTRSASGQKSPPPNASSQGNPSIFSSFKPTPPVSGRASPAVGSTGQRPPAKAGTPAHDSFSNLVAFGGSTANKNLSLQEQQKRLADSKLQQLVGQKKQLQDQWAGSDDVWNNLGSGRSTPAVHASNGTPRPAADEEAALFAAFNQPARSSQNTPAVQVPPFNHDDAADDDPFGLSEFQARQKQSTASPRPHPQSLDDDDDILGDLAKPVARPSALAATPSPRAPSPVSIPPSDHPQDRAVAELVDMGFPADKAKQALEATDTGLNVQAAVGVLLNQAHAEARQKARGRDATAASEDGREQPPRRPRPRPSGLEDEAGRVPRRNHSSPAANDPAKTAQDLGAAFMKSAGAFWKSAQKQVQQAVSEFNSDSESNSGQPKWMREPAAPQRTRDDEPEPRRERRARPPQSATDEAMMLETERPTPPPRQTPRSRSDRPFDSSADTSRDHSPALPSRLRETHSPQPAFLRQQQDPMASMMRPKAQPPPHTARAMLNKQAAEDQASQAYVSSARRRKPAVPANDGDLLDGSVAKSPPSKPAPARPLAPSRETPKPATAIQIRPPPASRNIPTVSPLALQASHKARRQGNDHFKRGDYSSAHESYSSSLKHLPAGHPLTLVLLTNRALTALKTGQPKVAVVDADTAVTVIGPSKGEGETVDLADGDSAPKPMKEYYGKALMRKAEALETLEKWSEAASVWRLCVEDGHGGATAIQGRARAEQAAAPKPPPAKRPPPPRAAPAVVPSAKPAAAVTALRAQHQAAEKVDDEKFALADVVAARVTGWKGGKEGNLRALLASLDTVLWEGAGWKKIGMADLVLANKVKIHYMKGIGKCHPDKIPTDATTEQRMIAGAVFTTLNEAWDKFKAENHL